MYRIINSSKLKVTDDFEINYVSPFELSVLTTNASDINNFQFFFYYY